jgi:hypothetical protein
LADDLDVNECDRPEIGAECQFGCENTHGSYRCLPAPTTSTETLTTASPSTTTTTATSTTRQAEEEDDENDDRETIDHSGEQINHHHATVEEREEENEIDYNGSEENRNQVERTNDVVKVNQDNSEEINYDDNYSDEETDNNDVKKVEKVDEVTHRHHSGSERPAVGQVATGKKCKSGLRLNDEGDCIGNLECGHLLKSLNLYIQSIQ